MKTAQVLLFAFGLMFFLSVFCGVIGFKKSSPGMWVLCVICMEFAIDIVGRATGLNLLK